MTNTVQKLMVRATATAAQVKTESHPGNYINVRLTENSSQAIVTTVIANKPLAWLSFDGPQLDELIHVLETYRKDLRD